MSFSSDVKEELSKISNLPNKEEVKAELIGYLLTSNIDIQKQTVKYSTESQYNINRFGKLLSNLGYIDYKIEIQGKVYSITVKQLEMDEINYKENNIYLATLDKISNKENLEKALVRGCFMGSGSINNPKNKYHMEILFSLEKNAKFILEILNEMIFKREGEQKQKTFTPKISGIKGTIIRGILTLGCLPYKAYISAKAIIVTLYRVHFSHMHLLEWTTSEEAEKQAKSGLISYYNQMAINVLSGLISIGLGSLKENICAVFLGVFWIFIPICMWYISKDEKKKNKVEELKQTISMLNIENFKKLKKMLAFSSRLC